MDVAALRREFPVLERLAYLNAGTDGPLASAAVRSAQLELEAALGEGRATSHFERRFELQAKLREGYARVMGAAVEADFGDRLSLTVIATRRKQAEADTGDALAATVSVSRQTEVVPPSPMGESPSFDTEFFEKTPSARPASRFVPPPPDLDPDQKAQLLAQQNGKTYRAPKSKMRQGMLPLEIVSKGRFEKSEPTIHHGEDLDVPTYIRRGVPLN